VAHRVVRVVDDPTMDRRGAGGAGDQDREKAECAQAVILVA
jgi:hypothetical protein